MFRLPCRFRFERLILGGLILLVGPPVWSAAEDSTHPDQIEVSRVFVKLAQQVSIPAEQAGILEEILVREGDTVHAGQVIATLRDHAARATLARTLTQLQMAEHQALDLLLIDSATKKHEQELQLTKQREIEAEMAERQSKNFNRLQAAEKALELANNELLRAEKAKGEFRDSVSQSEIENLRLAQQRASLDARQAQFERELDGLRASAAVEALKTARLSAEHAKVQVEQAQAEQTIAKMQKELRETDHNEAKRMVEQHRLRTPFDGVVVERFREVGEWVETGTSVVRVLKVDRLLVEGYIPLTAITFPLKGAPCKILLTAEGNKSVEVRGKIVFVNPKVDSVNSEVTVWGEFENPELIAKPGMQGRMTIIKPSEIR